MVSVSAAAAAMPSEAAEARGRGPISRRRRRLTAFRIVVLVIAALFFLTPILAMIEFSTRGTGISAARTLTYWRQIFDYPDLIAAIQVSLELAAITSIAGLLLLVPTMIWVRLRLPKLRRVIEFLCLLPLTVPAIVLVVGLAPVYAWVTYLFGDSTLTLGFAYVVLVLPYTYRVLDAGLSAIDVRTLSEAARSLGRRLGHRDVADRGAQHAQRPAQRGAALRGPRAGRVHHRPAAQLREPPGRDQRCSAGPTRASRSPCRLRRLFFAFVLLVGLSFVGRRRSVSVQEEE